MYGILGIFLTGFFGSLIVFVPLPYHISIAFGALFFDPTIVAIAAATGSTIAKIIIFMASYMGSNLFSKKTHTRIRPLKKFLSRYGGIATFVVAATPLPDDIVYVPLGLAKYSVWKFILATFSGKLVLAMVIAWGSKLSLPFIYWLIGDAFDPLIGGILAAILISIVAIAVYSMLKLDWKKVLSRWFPWTVEED
jgi:uncharacterized membrane protein YdjX (TVP38/TMEM64 family)